jgi:diguanylate cyclase (GGDEF)-like protein/putative nucleotidyltransferase with HDIG domain
MAMSKPRIGVVLGVPALLLCIAGLAGLAVDLAARPLRPLDLVCFAGLGAGALAAIGILIGLFRAGPPEGSRSQSKLKMEALTDSLTGLRNHRAFHEDLARELALADAHGQPLGLVLLDLDGLKLRNDRFGHQAGDQLILQMARVVTDNLRHNDMAYRIGGDEFAILLPGQSTWGAFRFAQRVHALSTALPPNERFSASAGVSGSRGQSRDELIREADLALIAAKRGRRGALIFTDDLAVREQGYQSADRMDHTDLICSALARAVDARDSFTGGHSETVGELAAQIAAELGFEPTHVTRIRRAGLLHDVGKIGIPDAILMKPGPLDPGEVEVMRTHPALGHQIVMGAGLDEEARWVLHHHERTDGGGYPGRLVGQEIPIESAIIHVADAFEAMISDRPYRRGRPYTDAMLELERHAGTQFLREAVEALSRVLAAENDPDTPQPYNSLTSKSS